MTDLQTKFGQTKYYDMQAARIICLPTQHTQILMDLASHGRAYFIINGQ